MKPRHQILATLLVGCFAVIAPGTGIADSHLTPASGTHNSEQSAAAKMWVLGDWESESLFFTLNSNDDNGARLSFPMELTAIYSESDKVEISGKSSFHSFHGLYITVSGVGIFRAEYISPETVLIHHDVRLMLAIGNGDPFEGDMQFDILQSVDRNTLIDSSGARWTRK